MKDVRPVRAPARIEPFRKPVPPVAAKRLEDERAVLEELGQPAADDVEIEDDALFLRPGVPRDVARKLRRGHWRVQADLDLHGMNTREAAAATAAFLAECLKLGIRCVRIVHGKGLGSHRKEPVLKHRVRKLLQRRDEVLAYVEPRAIDGGGGAVLVLLRG